MYVILQVTNNAFGIKYSANNQYNADQIFDPYQVLISVAFVLLIKSTWKLRSV